MLIYKKGFIFLFFSLFLLCLFVALNYIREVTLYKYDRGVIQHINVHPNAHKHSHEQHSHMELWALTCHAKVKKKKRSHEQTRPNGQKENEIFILKQRIARMKSFRIRYNSEAKTRFQYKIETANEE